jgi:RNA-directed DNA polymerase
MYHLQRWSGRNAVKVVRDKIGSLAGRQQGLYRSLKEVTDKLNPILKGWGKYFAVGNPSRQFQKIDSYVQKRLFLALRKNHVKRGRNWGTRRRKINF